MLQVEVQKDSQAFWVEALIDSGADYNMAPVELAELFEIDLSSYPSVPIEGVEQSKTIHLAIVPLILKVGGCSIQSYLGFGGNLPNILLGQKGFFDKLKNISFKYPKYTELKLLDSSHHLH